MTPEEIHARFVDAETGTVAARDLEAVLHAAGITERAQIELIETIVQPQRGPVVWAVLRQAIELRDGGGGGGAPLSRHFRLFDADDKGAINYGDVRRVADALGETLSDGEIREMIDLFSDTGSLSRDQFERIMRTRAA